MRISSLMFSIISHLYVPLYLKSQIPRRIIRTGTIFSAYPPCRRHANRGIWIRLPRRMLSRSIGIRQNTLLVKITPQQSLLIPTI